MSLKKLTITKHLWTIAAFFLMSSCHQNTPGEILNRQPYVIVLGIAQDAGYPQIGCKKSCCEDVWSDPTKREKVSCLGLVDPSSKSFWIFDATPDFKDQYQTLANLGYSCEGIFLTHAHMGHYTGLMHLGREAMGAKNIAVYAMPKMIAFLKSHGPWSQLVSLENIKLQNLKVDSLIQLTNGLSVSAFLVPHRDEFSETVGYQINNNSEQVIFIPDIDKWNTWDRDIDSVVMEADRLYLDGTFFRNGEIWGRDMSEIPHPFIEESMNRFDGLSDVNKNKIHFIHLNHTNPAIRGNSESARRVLKKGYHVAQEGDMFIFKED